MKRLLATFLAALVSVPVSVQADEVTEIRKLEEFERKSDKSYLLLRVLEPGGKIPSVLPILLRVPTQAERSQYDSAVAADPERAKTFDDVTNLNGIKANRQLMKLKEERTYLVEITPGDYVLYGLTASPRLHFNVCLCLGTVGFEAKAGQVIDLGTFLSGGARWESPFPELADLTNMGPSSDTGMVTWVSAIRPNESAATTAELRALSPVRAKYHAVGRFIDPRAYYAVYLPAIPGISSYRNGRVFDEQTGEIVPDRLD